MALLFIKQKFFPGQTKNRKTRDSSMDLALRKEKAKRKEANKGYIEKPLLSPEDSDTLHGSDDDLESQRSYSTFRNPSDLESSGSSSSSDSDSGGSGTSNNGNGPRVRINPRIVSDAILGLSDGLTVPFALSAGLSALGNTKVVVVGGLAELTAGAISMGLGGYVGAKIEGYASLYHFCSFCL